MKLWCHLGLHKWSKWIRTGKYVKERACYRCGISEDSPFFSKDEMWVDFVFLMSYDIISIWLPDIYNYSQQRHLAQETKWAEGKRKIEAIIQKVSR